ncbi:hypothetical protein SAMN05216174_108282 [Actinokineospora iranica]|uniref:Uncharacterized protein n=1 Tax=Actinokineospora iranica TaxID=1271860 RepID=A0A1G6T1D1_9PSEU|nr:hypothetical protein SAMN05216174_108282 [Actinokineospora iranica]
MHTLITLDAEYWLRELRRRRWQIHPFRAGADSPTAFAAVLTWPSVHDAVNHVGYFNRNRLRTPRDPRASEFAPTQVIIRYSGLAGSALRWILTPTPPGNEIPTSQPVPPDFAMPEHRYPQATTR